MILFIGAILVAATIVGASITITMDVSNTLNDVSERASGELSTDIDIINDVGSNSSVYDSANNSTTLYVKNTGTRVIETHETTLLINGEFYEPDSITIKDGKEWRVGNVARIDVNDVTLPDGENRITVEVLHAEDTLRFVV